MTSYSHQIQARTSDRTEKIEGVKMRAAIEISMYPLTEGYIPRIQAFIDRLNAYAELQVKTNTMGTQLWGPLDAAVIQDAGLTMRVVDAGY
jgi:uncharacterized protein YqgV (UPF0045/DUF77 family)